MGLEKTPESLLDSKEIQPVNPRGNQSWIFIRKTDAEAAAPVIWSPDVKSWLIGKDPDAGKDERQEEKGTTEDERDGITNSMGTNFSKLWEIVRDREDWGAAVHEVAESDTTEWMKNKFLYPAVYFVYRISSLGLVALEGLGSHLRTTIFFDSVGTGWQMTATSLSCILNVLC